VSITATRTKSRRNTVPADQYTRELYTKFRYRANWLPSAPIALGDVGAVVDNSFIRAAGLKDFGINFEVREPDQKSGNDLTYQSSSGISMTFKAAGDPAPAGSELIPAKAGVAISFEREAGILFVAPNCRVSSIKNQIEVGEKIKALYKQKQLKMNQLKWEWSYCVITELVTADSLTALVSQSAGGKVDLIAEGAVGGGAFALADLNAQFQIKRTASMSAAIVATAKLTPLFRVRRLNRPWLVLPPIFQASNARASVEAPTEDVPLEELSFDIDNPTDGA
jgi:hypothetical protein